VFVIRKNWIGRNVRLEAGKFWFDYKDLGVRGYTMGCRITGV
jgi:hypothetical protein